MVQELGRFQKFCFCSGRDEACVFVVCFFSVWPLAGEDLELKEAPRRPQPWLLVSPISKGASSTALFHHPLAAACDRSSWAEQGGGAPPYFSPPTGLAAPGLHHAGTQTDVSGLVSNLQTVEPPCLYVANTSSVAM